MTMISMSSMQRFFLASALLLQVVQGFAPLAPMAAAPSVAYVTPTFLATASFVVNQPLLLSAATIDPTTFLSNIFVGIVGTPLILAVPIVAALAVASLLAFLIVAYANPAEQDD